MTIDPEQIKTGLADLFTYLQNVRSKYSALALLVRVADADTLRAMVDEQIGGMSVELLLHMVRIEGGGSVDRAMSILYENMITRARELGMAGAN